MLKLTDILGAWSLETYVETNDETGELVLPMGENPTGILLYTSDGFMSAQLGKGARPHFASDDMVVGTEAEYAAAGNSYLAYSGPFRLDEAAQRLEHAMSVSLFPNWQGQHQIRLATLKDGKLHLTIEHPMLLGGKLMNAELVWTRASARP